MGLMKKIVNLFYVKDKKSEAKVEQPAPTAEVTSTPTPTASAQSTTQSVNMGEVPIFYPTSLTNVEQIIIKMRETKEAMLISLSKVPPELGQRFLDIFSGAVTALNGTTQPISNGIFLLTPNQN